MRKILSLIVMLLMLYVVTIFLVPSLAKKIDIILGIEGFSNYVLEYKDLFNNTVTNIPTSDEFENTYNSTISGAIDLKDKFIDTAESIRDGVDTVRDTLSGAADTYGQIKDTVETTSDAIKKTADTVKNAADTIKDVSDSLNNINSTGSTN